MKIGILSMQRVPNYGSFLQVYALKSLLEEIGAEVTFIDYKPGKPVVPYSKKKRIKFLIANVPFISWMRDYYKYNIKKSNDYKLLYRKKYLSLLDVGYRHNYKEKVDIAVIGSDEVFNCLQPGVNVGFSPMLFGQNINAKKVYSYAGSFGYATYDALKESGCAEQVAKWLKQFVYLSVRDDNSQHICYSLSGISPEIHLDPVLIYDFSVPVIQMPYKQFAILYTYDSRNYSESEKQEIIQFCKMNNLELISIGRCQKWVSNKIEANPFELLAYINAASFIITDTFHGSVFSIKYKKNFACYVRDDNKNKLLDLLTRLSMTERIISSFSELDEKFHTSTDYSKTEEILNKEKTKTKEYLRKIVND